MIIVGSVCGHLSCVGGVQEAFLPAYITILNRRKDMPFTPKQKEWQGLRRGHYVEYNLMIDEGTQYGLKLENPRVESILLSMPLVARWEYKHQVQPGSEEEKMLKVLMKPVEWIPQDHKHRDVAHH